MVVFVLQKLHLLYFFDNLVAQSNPHTKKLCATLINKSIKKMEKGKDGIVMHQHAFY